MCSDDVILLAHGTIDDLKAQLQGLKIVEAEAETFPIKYSEALKAPTTKLCLSLKKKKNWLRNLVEAQLASSSFEKKWSKKEKEQEGKKNET